MKKLFLLALLAPALMASCSNDGPDDYGRGSITLNSKSSIDADELVTRETVPVDDLTEYTLILEGPEQRTLQCPEDGKIEGLPTGQYTVTLTSLPEDYTPDFEDPRYSGSKQAVVAKDENTEVELTLTQANAGVYFFYDLSLAANGLDDVIPTVTQDAGALTYEDDNSEAKGYFVPGEAVLTVRNGSTPILIGGLEGRTLNLGRQQLWKITLKVVPGSGGLTITAEVDITTVGRDEEIVLDPPAPTGAGITIAGLENGAVNVKPLNGEALPISLDDNGFADLSGLGDDVIEFLEIGGSGNVVHVGRRTTDDITLKVEGGALVFRDADDDGNVPVGTISELQLINTDFDSRNGNYAQEADLDLMSKPWSPIGPDMTNAFLGNYDGGNFKIHNLLINNTTSNYLGFFGYNAGNISNLHIASGEITTTRNFVGAIVGDNIGGTVIGVGEVGIIENCSNAATVSGGSNIGGICGRNTQGVIKGCINTGAITAATWNVGGICGTNRTSSVIDGCQNSGAVTGNGSTSANSSNYVGGIAGVNEGATIKASLNTGAITTYYDYVGGIAGYNKESTTNPSTISGCENKGKVMCNANSWRGAYAGGIAGANAGGSTIENCTNNAEVENTQYPYVGGIAGSNTSGSMLDNCINKGTITAKGNYAGGITGSNEASTISECTNEAAVSGTGTHLGGIGGQNVSVGIIDACTNKGAVTGTTTYVGGVCGYAKSASTVIRNSLNTAAVEGKQYTGGVLGYSEDSAAIQTSANKGGVTGTSEVGGVCGHIKTKSMITACYNTGDIAGSSVVGGVVGNGYGGNQTVSACYSTGKVNAAYSVGGIVGAVTATPTIVGCYWLDGVEGSDATQGVGSSTAIATTIFGATGDGTGWPQPDDTNWATGDGTTGYWKSLGGWNSGTATVFPTLWWE